MYFFMFSMVLASLAAVMPFYHSGMSLSIQSSVFSSVLALVCVPFFCCRGCWGYNDTPELANRISYEANISHSKGIFFPLIIILPKYIFNWTNYMQLEGIIVCYNLLRYIKNSSVFCAIYFMAFLIHVVLSGEYLLLQLLFYYYLLCLFPGFMLFFTDFFFL